LYLWRKTFQASRGGYQVKKLFNDIHVQVLKFGTTRNLLAEENRLLIESRNCCSKFILSPEGHFHKVWDLYVIFLLLYTAFFTPYKLAFIDEETFTIYVFELIVDLSFWTDIVVNFLTAYEDPIRGKLIKDYKRIAHTYLTGWFFLDFTACIPVDQIMALI
jgi:hypothetical protein